MYRCVQALIAPLLTTWGTLQVLKYNIYKIMLCFLRPYSFDLDKGLITHESIVSYQMCAHLLLHANLLHMYYQSIFHFKLVVSLFVLF